MVLKVIRYCLLSAFIFAHVAEVSATDIHPVRYLFTVAAKSGKPLKQPSAAVVAKDGRIYVMDGVNNRVAVFNPSGDFLFDFGKGGDEKGEFNFPLGIAVDKANRVYVADSGNGRVQVFSHEGEFLYHIDIPKGAKAPDPTDLVVTEDGKLLYIVDNENHRLLYYNLSERKFINTVGKMGMRGGEFRWPFSIALDKEGNQYIVDVMNTTIRVVHPEGRFTFDIGSWGVNKGEFFRPKGVAVDSKGRVYVSDSFVGVVQVFDQEGKFLYVIGDESGKMKKFFTPVRLYIDKEDRLFVTEMFANKISVYKL